MLITPDRGKKIFGVLMILAAIVLIAASLAEIRRAKFRTAVTEAHVLSSFEVMMGIGPLRHASIKVKYEFVANGARFEKEQLVDNLPGGAVQVYFDPRQPQNNRLALPDTSSQFVGITAGLLLLIGVGLTINVWKRPMAHLRSARTS
jgi:hypothetical protein